MLLEILLELENKISPLILIEEESSILILILDFEKKLSAIFI